MGPLGPSVSPIVSPPCRAGRRRSKLWGGFFARRFERCTFVLMQSLVFHFSGRPQPPPDRSNWDPFSNVACSHREPSAARHDGLGNGHAFGRFRTAGVHYTGLAIAVGLLRIVTLVHHDPTSSHAEVPVRRKVDHQLSQEQYLDV